MVTGKQYAAEALKVLDIKPAAGYIWGTMNKLWTAADQAALEKKYNSNPSKYSDLELGAKVGSKWIGHLVWDCSGLTKYCGVKLGLSFHHGSNSSWNYDCQYKGKFDKGMKLPVGAWVYTGTAKSHGHIGIVVDDTWVVEAQGTKSGVVKSKLSLKKWTYWGLAKGMSFDFIPGVGKIDNKPVETVVQVPKTTTSSTSTKKPVYPTIRRGDRGEVVTQCQRLLAKDGSNLEIDGIFGPGTQSAVKAFQRRHGLTVDGIVGPQTWKALTNLV
jgi:hypothetical protein